MGNFKMWEEKPRGLCGDCMYAEVRRSCSNQFTVRCEANSLYVREPLDYCSDYRKKSIFGVAMAPWMRETAWLPIKADGRKTFVQPGSKDAEAAVFPFGQVWGELKKSKRAAFKE